MSYRYDPNMRRYVLNLDPVPSSPMSRDSISVSSDTPKSTKSPNIIRITSKSKMMQTEDLLKKAEEDSPMEPTYGPDPTKKESSVYMKPQPIYAKVQPQRFGNRQESLRILSKPFTAAPALDDSRSDKSSTSTDAFMSSTQISNSRTSTNKESKDSQTFFTRQPIRGRCSFITPSKRPSVEIKMFESEVSTPVKEANPSTALKEISKLLTVLPSPEKQDLMIDKEKKIRELQQINMDLKVENGILKKDISSVRSALTATENMFKGNIENMQTTISNYDKFKQNVLSRLGQRTLVSLDDIVKSLESKITQKDRFRQRVKELQAKTLEIDRMKKQIEVKDEYWIKENSKLQNTIKRMNEEIIFGRQQHERMQKQLNSNRWQLRKMQDELAKTSQQLSRSQQLKVLIEGDKRHIADLTRQLEDHKVQLRKTKEELANTSQQLNNSQQLKNIIEVDKRQIADLIRQLEQLRLYNYSASDKIQALQSQLSSLNNIVQIERSEKTKLLDQVNFSFKQINQLQNTVQSLLNQLHLVKASIPTQSQLNSLNNSMSSMQMTSYAQQELFQKSQIIDRLNKQIDQSKGQFKKSKSTMEQLRNDFNFISHMHAVKEQQLNELGSKLETVEETYKEKVAELEMQIETLELKIENIGEQHKEELKQLQKQNEYLKKQPQQGMPPTQTKSISSSGGFEEILRAHGEQIQILKRKLTEKQEKLFTLSIKLEESELSIDQSRDEFQLQKLKFITQKKTLINNHQAQLQSTMSELTKSQRIIQSLSNKIKQLCDQCKSKDTFIQKQLVGKASPQEQLTIEQFLKEYQYTFINYSKDKQVIEQLEENNRRLNEQLDRIKAKK